jgi:hypothetical protein
VYRQNLIPLKFVWQNSLLFRTMKHFNHCRIGWNRLLKCCQVCPTRRWAFFTLPTQREGFWMRCRRLISYYLVTKTSTSLAKMSYTTSLYSALDFDTSTSYTCLSTSFPRQYSGKPEDENRSISERVSRVTVCFLTHTRYSSSHHVVDPQPLPPSRVPLPSPHHPTVSFKIFTDSTDSVHSCIYPWIQTRHRDVCVFVSKREREECQSVSILARR